MDTMNCPKCNTPLAQNSSTCSKCHHQDPAPKSSITLLLLCLFLGTFGAHRFYVKKYGTGLLMLITLGGFGIWAFIDLLFITLNKFEDKNGNVMVLSANPSSFKKVCMVIGCIFAGILTIISIFFSVILFASSGLVAVANKQLSALDSGDIVKAYSYTSKTFQRATSLNDFKSFIKTFPALTHTKNVTFTSRDVKYNNGTSTGTIEGTLQSTDGVTSSVTYQFIKEDGVWKIEQLSIHQNASQQDKSSTEKRSLPLFFEDKNFGYAIRYPENWSYQQTGNGKVKLVYKQGNEVIYIEPLLSKKAGGIYENNKAVNNDYKNQFKTLAADFTVVEEGTRDLPKNPKNIHGEYFVATYTYQGKSLKRLQYVFTTADGKMFLVWSYVAEKKQFDGGIGMAKEILNSFDIQK